MHIWTAQTDCICKVLMQNRCFYCYFKDPTMLEPSRVEMVFGLKPKIYLIMSSVSFALMTEIRTFNLCPGFDVDSVSFD